MFTTFKIARKYGAKIAAGSTAALGSVAVFAQTVTDPESAITSAQVAVLAIVAAGGLAMILVALGSVGWNVGAKFVKRIGGKA